jgi:hypothetical protein
MRHLHVVAVGLWLSMGQAFAQDAADTTNPGSYSCADDKYQLIEEMSAQGTASHFNTIDQQIASLGYTRSQCATFLGKGRWYFEGILAGVKEEPITSGQVRFGLGYSYRLLARDDDDAVDLTFEPVASIGYLTRSVGSDYTVAGIRAEIGLTIPLSGSTFADGTNFIGYWQPAYTITDPTSSTPFFSVTTQAQFTNAVALSIDMPSSIYFGHWTSSYFRVSVENQYIDTIAPTDTINSIILAFRPVDSENQYYWNYQLFLSAGNGGYRSVTFAVTARL